MSSRLYVVLRGILARILGCAPRPAPRWTPVPCPAPAPATGLKSVPCPSCGAEAGAPCHNRRGKPFLQDGHRTRWAAAGVRTPPQRPGRKPRLTLHPCPACGAPVGEPCRSRSGKVAHSGHNPRRRAAGLAPRLRTGGDRD